jgi:hypothetical protein
MPEQRGRRLFILAGVVLAVIVVGVVFVVRARSNSGACFEQTYEFTGTTIRPPQQALNDYLANHEEPLPLGGWTVQVTTPDGAVFTSSEGGHWTAEVSGGQVRHYSGCRS